MKKQQPTSGFITGQLASVASYSEVKKAREEQKTGTKKVKPKYAQDEYDRIMDILLDSKDRKDYREQFAIAFPERSMDRISNNDPAWHYICRRKVRPAKRPIRRSRQSWTWADKHVLKLVAKQPLDSRAALLSRVAYLLRRTEDETLEPLIQALRAVSHNTLKTAQEMGLLK